MGIGKLTKVKGERVIGIDASTNSLAFAIFDNGKPVKCGEVVFKGATVFERLKDAKRKTRALVKKDILKGDYIVIESAIMVRNINTAIDLAYIFGCIIGELMQNSPEVHKVAPITWQTAIGNPNLKKHEKDAIQAQFPGKSKTWYSNKGREIRKDRTLAIARNYFKVSDGSDNVGDAIGLALYASKHLVR